jgi:hypothetical protein
VHVFGLAVHFDQLSLEVAADLLENGLEPLEGVSVKHPSSIFCDKDQVNMQCEHAMPAVTNIIDRTSKWYVSVQTERDDGEVLDPCQPLKKFLPKLRRLGP